MGVRSGATGWKLFVGLAVVCGVLVFAGGFLHRHAVDAAVEEQQAKLATYARTKLPSDVRRVDLSKPLKDADAKALARAIDAPAGVEVRIASTDGRIIYGAGGSVPDAEAVTTAAAGTVNHVIDRGDVDVYAPIPGKGGKQLGVAVMTADYADVRADASAPLDAFRVPLVGLALVFLVAGLALMVQQRRSAGAAEPAAPAKAGAKEPAKAASGSGRVSGFGPAPAAIEAADDGSDDAGPDDTIAEAATASGPAPTPASAKAKKPRKALFVGRAKGPEATEEAPGSPSASALEREVKIREALEDQLEQLRTRIQTQDEETARTTRELADQLAAMTARAEEAEARARDAAPGPAAPPEPEPGAPSAAQLADRVRILETQLSEATARAAEAATRADVLQRERDEAALATPDPAPARAEAEALTARVAEAEEKAAAAEQRAASIESVRDELEVRVAQLGAKATDLERQTTELESRLHDATAGGDAVRAEIATLTAALAAADARVRELEAGRPAASDEAPARDETPPARVEGPASVAEPDPEDVSALFAAAFSSDSPTPTPEHDTSVPPAPSDADRYDEVWSAPAAQSVRPPAELEPTAPSPSAVVDAPEPADEEPPSRDEPVEERTDDPASDADAPDEFAASEGMTAEDDLWALRARLARAGEEVEGSTAPPAWE